jgi:hypothetical protein
MSPKKSGAASGAEIFYLKSRHFRTFEDFYFFHADFFFLGGGGMGFSLIAASLVSTIVTILKLFRGMHALYFDFPYVAFIVSEASS